MAVAAPSTKRVGRPPSTRAQDAIRRAATELFAVNGFSGTSLRDIAAEANVDPALITRHFKTKEALFIATMKVDERFRDLIQGPNAQLGRTILRRLLENEPDQARIYASLLKALDRVDVRKYLLESTERHVVGPLRERLDGDDADIRARLVAAQIVGLWVAIWVFRSPDPDQTPLDDIFNIYGPGLQAVIDGRAWEATSGA